jgi:hypothetical protein
MREGIAEPEVRIHSPPAVSQQTFGSSKTAPVVRSHAPCAVLGDVAVDHHKPAARHRVAPHFDDAPVGPGVLEARFLAESFETAVQLRLDLGAAILATPGEGLFASVGAYHRVTVADQVRGSGMRTSSPPSLARFAASARMK